MAAYGPYVPLMVTPPAPMLEDYGELIGRGVVHVAEWAGSVVGLIMLWPESDHLYIDNIAVKPGSQGGGIGTALVEWGEDQARLLGFEEMRLYTNEVMTSNIDFYLRRGFVETHRAWHEGYARIFFTRHL